MYYYYNSILLNICNKMYNDIVVIKLKILLIYLILLKNVIKNTV